jgi:uncharacterized membrane protein
MFNKKIVIITIITALLDGIFLYLNRSFFNNQIIQVQGSPIKMDYFSAILCYAFLIFGLYYFIIKDNKPVYNAFLLGIVEYGVYELTTKALLKDWSYKTVILDTLWGGVLFSLTTYLTYHIMGNKQDFSVIHPASI